MPDPDAYPQLTIRSREDWASWLAANHSTARGVWLVRYRKGGGRPHVPYDDIVTEALAYGWIDSRPRSLDEERSQLLVTPRNPTSNWSARNKQHVARLIAAGRMTPAGLAAIEAAKANGAWNALDAVEALHEPDDLRDALDAQPDARTHWDAFPRSTRRAILEWIATARTPETRQRRVTETAQLATKNVRANQWRQPKGSARRTAPPTAHT